MIILRLLKNNKWSQYRLSKETGIGQATISDLCSGKTSLDKCAAGTLYKIAHALGTTVDALLEENSRMGEAEKHLSLERKILMDIKPGHMEIEKESNLKDILKIAKSKRKNP